ncbi:tRNA (adenosine(37)-N6)-threonylcarbamoyltransferase complex ATPase subunit type 1 TsaE [Oceanivirga salmonicida]|uniref:tRNA (adenosine(37)-N6)-threonylcarbamoyltransferase complex ATPase subunit type 1 TsaE n=1 Tax=Oceanivirga salmonicida TaxID=1769291 RepID=UPI0012E13AC6|nr:tRNA (adenosine(37)-N6)-threonylcarbamoyltransferase complex ATPase subunit type 1 TsaE [Oceanivirga salmonicida]
MLLKNTKLTFHAINEIIDELAINISKNKEKSICIGLIGDLGTGKTAFAKRLFSSLGVTETVKSPTFTYLIEYNADIDIYHFDVYRVNSEEELYNIGYYDYIDTNSLVLVEWANLILEQMPENTLFFEIKHNDAETRYISSYILKGGEKIYVDIHNYNFN